MTRRRILTILTAVIFIAGAVLVWKDRAQPVVLPHAAPTASTTVTPTVDPLVDLAGRFIAAWQYGEQGGGPTWTAKLTPVATPELVKTLQFMDPEDIPDVPVTATTVETPTTVIVTLYGGSQLRLTVADKHVAAVEKVRL